MQERMESKCQSDYEVQNMHFAQQHILIPVALCCKVLTPSKLARLIRIYIASALEQPNNTGER